MVGGSIGAVETYQVENNNIDIDEFVPGGVIVEFHKQLENLDPIDVRDIDSFAGHIIMEKIGVLNVAVVEVDEGDEQSYIESIIDSPFVKYAELNWIFYAVHTPNDPQWDAQWGPQRIHCEDAWDSQQGSSSVKIAIVDTGIDYTHEDIAGNYASGGYDWINSDNNPMDDNDHGTHCAGIAAAVIDNGVGIAGVAGKCKIMAEKVLGSGGSGSSSQVASGITHAADNGADVISLSLSSTSPSSTIESACNYAYNTKGVVIVAASGNDYNDEIGYPARYDTVIAVGAIDQYDERCGFSNYGEGLELVAPGKRILSTIIGDDYDYFTGTSMAAPHVAGVAALAISTYPSKDNEWIRQKMVDTAEDLGPAGWDEEFGYGLVDARLAVGGYEGESVNIEIYKVKGLDEIDFLSDPEWYYKVSLDSQSRFEYDGYEEQFLFWWRFVWNERNIWTPDKTYKFYTDNPEVSIKIKLMDDDIAFSDIADLSERPSDDFWGGEEGRIFTITYNLINNGITGDRYESDGSWLYTRGDWDGSTDPEGIDDPKQDDAQLWFKITDGYNPNDYKPKLVVNPTSINFGMVPKGDVVSAEFTVKNDAKEDDPFNPPQDLIWNIDAQSWISVSPSSGSLEPGEQESVTVEIDTAGMELKTWRGTITVSSNGGTEEISVIITIPRERSQDSLFHNLLEIFQSKFPLLFIVIKNLQVYQ